LEVPFVRSQNEGAIAAIPEAPALGKGRRQKKAVELNESREFDDLKNEEETERYKSGHWYLSKSEAPETAIIYCNRFLNALEECTMSGSRQPKNALLV
jgi:hypothetical protein